MLQYDEFLEKEEELTTTLDDCFKLMNSLEATLTKLEIESNIILEDLNTLRNNYYGKDND